MVRAFFSLQKFKNMLQKITSKIDFIKTIFALIPLLIMVAEILQFAQQKWGEFQDKHGNLPAPANYKKQHETAASSKL